MITHEEARKELEYFQQCVGLKLNKVNDYITQQEKVSKLYKEFVEVSNRIFMGTSTHIVDDRNRYHELMDEIEEELK